MPSTYPIKGITLTGWRLLLDEKINALPIDPFHIAKRHNIKVLTYSAYCEVTGMSRTDLMDKYGRDGFTLVIDKQYLIFYDECNNNSRIRWTVMHELSHIFLGHFDIEQINESSREEMRPDGKSRLEADADELTARILSPMVVMHFCCVSGIDEFRKLTGLSREASIYRWKRLCYLRRIKKFLRHQLELEVLQQFQEFITSYITGKVAYLTHLEPADNN